MTATRTKATPPVVEQPAPETPANPSLYLLGMQAQEISGEIALAAEMLESDDEEERIAAIALLEQALAAEEDTKAAMAAKAERYFSYRSVLLAQAEWRKAEAKRLTALAKADEARAEKMLDTAAKVFGTLYPEQNKFSFPSYELARRKSPGAVRIDNEILVPEDLPEAYVRIKLEIEVDSRERVSEIAEMPGVTAFKYAEAFDKTAIRAALKAGTKVEGLSLDTTPNWSVK
jgi:hypothetical protein